MGFVRSKDRSLGTATVINVYHGYVDVQAGGSPQLMRALPVVGGTDDVGAGDKVLLSEKNGATYAQSLAARSGNKNIVTGSGSGSGSGMSPHAMDYHTNECTWHASLSGACLHDPKDHTHDDLGGISQTDADARYLKLDCSNDPLTASLEVQGDVNLNAAGAELQIEGDLALSLEDKDGNRTNVSAGASSGADAGYKNTFVGSNAGEIVTSGAFNVHVGYAAGRYNTTANYQTCIGVGAGQQSRTGRLNVYVGYDAGAGLVGGGDPPSGQYEAEYNVVVGASAGRIKLGDENVIMGYAAYDSGGGGNQNTIIGCRAGRSLSGVSDSGCVFIGYKAGEDEIYGDRLYIENSDADKPLIYGEFGNDILITYADTAETSTVHRGFKVAHFSSGTPAADFGVGIAWRLETDQSYSERDAGVIDVVWTDATDEAEYADMIASVMANGSLVEGLRIRSDKQVAVDVLTVTDGVTAPSSVTGEAIIYVDTSDGDLKVKFSDGHVATIAADS